MAISNTVFSEYEIRELGVKLKGDSTTYKTIKCTGTVEEEAEVVEITKNCRGMVAKRRVKPTGTGTITISAHIPWDIFCDLYGYSNEGLVDGVMAYGKNGYMPEFSLVMDVYDEDGNEKFKAYPVCTMNTGPTRSTENGSEEVAEVECEIYYVPDTEGNGIYEAIAEDLGADTKQLRTKWMTAFEPSLVKASGA